MKNEHLYPHLKNRNGFKNRNRLFQRIHSVYRVFYPMFLLCIVVSTFACKASPKDQVQKILSDKQIPVEEKIRQTSFLLLGDRLKEIEIAPGETSGSGNVRVTLAVGGNSALTFLGQKEYKERMKLEIALLSFRLLQTLKNLPIESIRVSIIKPYYVKNSPTESIEEFEVFRARMEKNSMKSIQGFETVDSFAADSYDSPDPAVLDVMVQIVQAWKVELDELNRVEVN
nr:hypothetical protein [Leptospira stimsonii]